MKNPLPIIFAIVSTGASFGQIINVNLDSSHRGWVNDSGFNNPSNGVYISGSRNDVTYRSFFSFDLSGLSGSIESATLELDMSSIGYRGYGSSDPSEAFVVRDVSGPTTGGLALFNDIGSGSIYGFSLVDSGDSVVTVSLGADFLGAINSGVSNVTLGGSVVTIDGSGANEYLFGQSERDQGVGAARLALTVDVSGSSVPEPSTSLLGTFVLAMCVARRRR